MMNVIDHITGLTSDSRDVKKGYLFAALVGTRFDGRDYIDQAILNGATHVLVPMGTPLRDDVTMMESKDIRRDFAKLAAAFYHSQPSHIVAVTGTNGKTSTVDFIRQILEIEGLNAASLGTLGLISKTVEGENKMTTPDPVKLHALLADLKGAGVDYLAMEASSHGLHQYRLDGIQPKVVAFTNLTQDHLDYHETMDDYFAAKNRLFNDILPHDGYAVINIDDPWSQKIHRREMTYGQDSDAVIRLLSQIPTTQGQDIQIQYQDEIYNIHLPLIGLFQAYNILCAAACCIMLQLDPHRVFNALKKLTGVAGRMQLAASGRNNRAAYVDYAHTPDALEKVLTSLRPHVQGRLICVFGAGGDRDKGKRPLMGRIAAQYADHVIVTDDNPRSEDPSAIRDQIMAACPNADNIGDRKQAIIHAVDMLQDGDIVLIAGKGHEQGQIIGDHVIPFDDVTEAQQAMEQYQ